MSIQVERNAPPRKVLVVDTVDSDAMELVQHLIAPDIAPKVALGGLYALTMLERERPHLIVTRADLGDMTGGELCSMVKRDSALADVRVVLLARHLDERARAQREADFDLVLLDDSPLGVTADRLRQLVQQRPRPSASDTRGRPSEAKVITGSLGVLSFAELTQAFSQTGKTGCLELDVDVVSGDRARVYFAGGTVRHAEYGASSGVQAFVQLFYDVEEAVDTAFRFQPMAVEVMTEQPRTIDRTAQQLLLSAAVDLDENETDEIALAELRRRMAREEARSETEPGHDAPE
ncbi:MAG: DUF4388 domain-containing protein [Acidobacteriota bacterium]